MKLFLIASGGLFVCWEAWHCSQKETDRERQKENENVCLSMWMREADTERLWEKE